jgi:hypothetical protein
MARAGDHAAVSADVAAVVAASGGAPVKVILETALLSPVRPRPLAVQLGRCSPMRGGAGRGRLRARVRTRAMGALNSKW